MLALGERLPRDLFEVEFVGTSGYLVPAGQPQDLARAMSTVMELPDDERQAMGDAGRAHIVGTFDLTAVVDRWEALYLAELRDFKAGALGRCPGLRICHPIRDLAHGLDAQPAGIP